MNVSMKYLLSLAAISLAVSSTAARADVITFIPGDFNPVLSSGNDNATLISYQQNNWLVVPGGDASTTQGAWTENFFQGNPAPGVTTGGSIASTTSLTITDGGNLFDFGSFDLRAGSGSGGTAYWSIYNGATKLASGTDSNSAFETVDTGITGDYTALTLQVSDINPSSPHSNSGSFIYVDNINVAPEPSSLILAGTGLLGLAASVRRRLAV
jgi:hypothetical protein